MDMQNGHMFIYIIERENIGISKFEKYVTISQFRYETLLPLSLKVFRHKEREAQSILAFSSAPHFVQHLPKASVSK